MASITPSARLRASPFYERTLAEGVTHFTSYNRMLMPTGFGNPDAEYRRLIEGVSLWDVAVERQVELAGRDAMRLAQILSPRRLDACKVGQGKYVPLCDHEGRLVNDPVLLKLAEDRVWLSIADSDIGLWAKAIAAERGLDVRVGEPDVSPLAVQGPKAADTVAAVFGDWVRGLKHFWFRETEVEGIPVVVARSGWSRQGGFEIYLRDGSKGGRLWDILREAGAPWGIGPGNPNLAERVESGLLSFGGDTDPETNPFEVRLERYIDLDAPDDTVGIKALRRIKAEGPRRHQLGLMLDDTDRPGGASFGWMPVFAEDGRPVGHMTNIVWSPRLKRNIGFALVSRSVGIGDAVSVEREGRRESGRLQDLPFI